jgi:Skp family chaperone for outer membrane proteins
MIPVSHLLRPAAGIALALALHAGSPAPAAAAPKKPAVPIVPGAPTYVDIGRLLSEYRKTPAFAKYQQKLREQARAFTEEMRTLAQCRYCSDEEREEVLQLKVKPKPTDKEKARLEALMKKADALDNELATLSQKTEPTEADRQRIQELSRKRSEAVRELAKEEADRRDQLKRLEAEAMAEVEKELLNLVAKLAKDQKVEVIYERRAVLFGGNDLTEEVIKKLPK